MAGISKAERNSETGRMVNGYRRLVTTRNRARIARLISRDTRETAKRILSTLDALLSAPAHYVRVLVAMLRARQYRDTSTVRVLKVGRVARLGIQVVGLSPGHARAQTLSMICKALEESEIRYFCVRNSSVRSTAVAVQASDRRAVERTLRGLSMNEPVYVSSSQFGDRNRLLSGRYVASWRRLTDSKIVRLTRFLCDPTGQLVLGHGFGCDIEFWTEEEGLLHAPRGNTVTETVSVDAEITRVPATVMVSLGSMRAPELPDASGLVTASIFLVDLPEDILYPIDAVYTWVDDTDPLWNAHRHNAMVSKGTDLYHHLALSRARFRNRDELKFSLRSLEQHAPWLRYVYLVTCGQRPAWLNTEHPRLRLVDHQEIFTDPHALPTFNSHAIESQLHRIPDLSNQFLYFNDDVFLGRYLSPRTFFSANGLTKFFPSAAKVCMSRTATGLDPVSAAGVNNRELIERAFDRVLTQKMRHTPHSLRKDVLAEIEERFPEAHKRTATATFRSSLDISVASSLHHYYAYLTGRALPGEIRNSYIDMADAIMESRLLKLLGRRNADVFCINDTTDEIFDAERRHQSVTEFLESYFPVPSSFETLAPVTFSRGSRRSDVAPPRSPVRQLNSPNAVGASTRLPSPPMRKKADR
ncbi:stealth family protein [Streptomyces vinaceus]